MRRRSWRATRQADSTGVGAAVELLLDAPFGSPAVAPTPVRPGAPPRYGPAPAATPLAPGAKRGKFMAIKRQKKIAQPADHRRSAGLCGLCVTATACQYRHPSDQPVGFCEEFDGGSPVSRTKPPRPLRAAAVEAEPALPPGLCRQCDNRQSCAFTKPEGGVWHCEEYC